MILYPFVKISFGTWARLDGSLPGTVVAAVVAVGRRNGWSGSFALMSTRLWLGLWLGLGVVLVVSSMFGIFFYMYTGMCVEELRLLF
mmetsp:Transcript_31506/g.36225  ORF Transcript_31506/g.36225 Transcript_31506/m.36225 type:complete len:87 (-) Transcript_31506:3-263(-)